MPDQAGWIVKRDATDATSTSLRVETRSNGFRGLIAICSIGCGIRLRGAFSSKLADLFKLLRPGLHTPLEEGRFGRREHGPGKFHATQRHFIVDLVSGSNRISSNIDAPALGKDIMNRLLHAHMGLNAGDEQAANALLPQFAEQAPALATTEHQLFWQRA